MKDQSQREKQLRNDTWGDLRLDATDAHMHAQYTLMGSHKRTCVQLYTFLLEKD